MEVKMTMEEYKKLEEAKQDYEILKMHIRQCAEIKEEYSKNPIGFNSGMECRRTYLVANIDLGKLTNVLQTEVKFAEEMEIDRIIYKEIKEDNKRC